MSLKITEYEVLADVKEDLTLLFFSDTHNCQNESLLKILRQEKADAVLCGGDILHNPPEVVKIKLQKTNNLIKRAL